MTAKHGFHINTEAVKGLFAFEMFINSGRKKRKNSHILSYDENKKLSL